MLTSRPRMYGHARARERPVWLLFLARGLKVFFCIFFCTYGHARTSIYIIYSAISPIAIQWFCKIICSTCLLFAWVTAIGCTWMLKITHKFTCILELSASFKHTKCIKDIDHQIVQTLACEFRLVWCSPSRRTSWSHSTRNYVGCHLGFIWNYLSRVDVTSCLTFSVWTIPLCIQH